MVSATAIAADDDAVTANECRRASERLPLCTSTYKRTRNLGLRNGQDLRPPHSDPSAIDNASGSQPREGNEVLHEWKYAKLVPGFGNNGTGHQVLRSLLQCPCVFQQLGTGYPRDTGHVRHRHFSLGDGSGLVEHDGVDLSGCFERLVALEEDSQAGTHDPSQPAGLSA